MNTAAPTDSSLEPLPLFPPRKKAPRRSGWYVGIVLGVLVGLWTLPQVRYTLSAQIAFAFAEDSIPWMRALDTRHSARETARLETAAALVPGDYLMQIGHATAPTNEDERTPSAVREEAADQATLIQLAGVVNDFPAVPGGYAHLARYMMSSRVRIRRGEIDSRFLPAPPESRRAKPDKPDKSASRFFLHRKNLLPLGGNTPQAQKRDIQIIEWAMQTGELRDRDNAFWPVMLATAYFSVGRDKEALAALQKASHKSEWNAYIHEEVLGQWRLYSAAYGDRGAAQKIAPLSLISFPHLLEIRHAAEMARCLADRAADAGRPDEAIRIRRDVAWLGIRMRDTAQWSLEALCGADLVLIISSDSKKDNRPFTIQNVVDWEKSSANYRSLLRRRGMNHEMTWLREEAENSCALRARVDIARYDASYPGIPPGIPLMPLFGDWVIGVCLLQQMFALGFVALLAALCRRRLSEKAAQRGRFLAPLAAFCGLLACVSLLCAGIPQARDAAGCLICATVLILFAMEAVSRKLRRRFPERGFAVLRDSGQALPPAARPAPESDQEFVAETRWNAVTTGLMLLFLLPGGVGLLYYLRPQLSFLHPVATLLMSVMGTARVATLRDALELGLLACGLPIAFALLVGIWSLMRRVSPLAGLSVGLRRFTLPMLACLSLTYLVLLDRTLQLDAAASRGISEVAQNDLQWVLTHSEPPASEDE